jgi:hypothetical protein
MREQLMETRTDPRTARTVRLRERIAARLYDWVDARRWYWTLGDPVVPALRDWPVARSPRRPRR